MMLSDIMSFSVAKISSQLVRSIDQYFNLYLAIAYGVLGLFGILNHAMWRDEINVWLITRDSPSIAALIENVRYEGHPLIWYLCLYALHQITSNPVIMQVFHWMIGVAIAGLFLYQSPFSRLYKALFIFGYFPFYEYFLISRNYSLGILFLFLFCTFFQSRKTNYLPCAICLALLANTNAFALFLSFCLGVMLIAEYRCNAGMRQLQPSPKGRLVNVLFSLLIWLAGLAVSLVMLIPPSDANLAGGWEFNFQIDWSRLFQVLSIVWKAHIPILKPADQDTLPFGLISIFLWLWISVILMRKPLILLLHSLGTVLILAFCYVKFIGVERHHGHLFILLVTCLWLAEYYPNHDGLDDRVRPFAATQRSLRKLGQRLIHFCQQYQQQLLTFIFVAHVLTGIVAWGRDLVLPYSASRATAHYIQSQHLDTLFMVGSRDFAVSPICGYLNRKVYYPEIQAEGSYVLFKQTRQEVNLEQILRQVSEFSKIHTDILLILSPEVMSDTAQETISSFPQIQVTPIATFTHGLIGNEKYALYRVRPQTKVA